MKNMILSITITLLIASCSKHTDMQTHTHSDGDVYCAYTAKGAGEGSFNVCVFCPKGRAECATIKEARLPRAGSDSEYDVFTLTPVPGSIGCDVCTGDYYWEKK
jgi:hypothetical protein